MRSPFLLALALILPASVKKRVVDGLSRNSRRHVTVSSDERLGIPLRQYEALLEHADLVIHGHTHPPRDSAQPAAQVRVLIAWESPEDALILE